MNGEWKGLWKIILPWAVLPALQQVRWGDLFQQIQDYKFKASIYSYSISKGAYIGVSFQGSAIEEDNKANELFYGKSISNRTILGNKITVNPAVLKLLLLIKKVSK